MAKAGKRAKPKAAAVRPSIAAPGRRTREPEPAGKSAPRPSPAMRLAAEVERLELELKAARGEIEALAARADVDPLTDALNRRGFERELKRSLAYVKRYGASAALIYVDLDRFKLINDRHGHAAGDAMLKAVTMVIARQVRASDVVARLGGDEFAVLLWNLSEIDAQSKAQALEAAIGRTTATHGGAVFSVGASIGAAMLLPLDRPAEVLERADAAMYARKAVRNAARAAS